MLLHDWASADLTLNQGVVAFVDTHKRLNGVGIRLSASNGERRVLWPSSHAVHPDPRDPTEPCRQCQALAEQGERPPDAPAQEAPRADDPLPPQPVLSTAGIAAG